jgi:membrane-associated protease RseP (regulator of RpoE activity)
LAAIPVICIGIMLSRTIPKDSLPGGMSLGEPLIFQFLTWLIKGPAPANTDILIHPVAFAGWFGLLATTFNLFPAGQLDGGHILYALIGRKSYYAGIVSILAILLLGVLFWPGWLIWALLVTIIGLRHPPVYEEEKLDRHSYLWGVASLIIFLLSFTPAPIRGIF